MGFFRLPPVRFAAVLTMVLAAILAWFPATTDGDFFEYGVTTVALATHGSPALRSADAATAARLAPGFKGLYEQLGRGIDSGDEVPMQAFYRGRSGAFSLHFWLYPALAAPIYLLLDSVGANPFKCFQVLNLAMVLVLGLALFRFYRSAAPAFAGLLLLAVCGGELYWSWTGAEMLSAAGLLAAMLFFASGALLRAGLLVGLAATQNPPAVAVALFGPLLACAVAYAQGADWRAAARQVATGRNAAAVLLALALAALPVVFSLWQFGEPSLIAKFSTSSDFVSWQRLHSFFFDLNQGMVVGVPVLMAASLAAAARTRHAPLVALCWLLVLAMAVPALSAYNWNSGAVGILRYAFWCAMPLLFALLVALRGARLWPAVVLLVALPQAGCMWHARSYAYWEFSPLARLALERAPQFYNPIAEIFIDRVEHAESLPDEGKVVTYRDAGGKPLKTLFHRSNGRIGTILCGQGATLAPGNLVTPADGGWVYLDGQARCSAAGQGQAGG